MYSTSQAVNHQPSPCWEHYGVFSSATHGRHYNMTSLMPGSTVIFKVFPKAFVFNWISDISLATQGSIRQLVNDLNSEALIYCNLFKIRETNQVKWILRMSKWKVKRQWKIFVNSSSNMVYYDANSSQFSRHALIIWFAISPHVVLLTDAKEWGRPVSQFPPPPCGPNGWWQW